MTEIHDVLKKQRQFFNTGQTRDISFRIKQLKLLKHGVATNQDKILDALHQDLGKSAYESYLTEVGLVLTELGHITRKLPSWAKPRKAITPYYHFPAKSVIHPEPFGVALIMSPWNYPFQLAFSPLASALAAGNCVILKPSEFAPHTGKVMAQILQSLFAPGHVLAINGDQEVSEALLKEHFNYIFYTGGAKVGKIVMTAAARRLTPVTLELGGKSPCIVDQNANIKLAARRIVSGKFINAGQTCIAPDYLLVHAGVKEPLIDEMIRNIEAFYGQTPINCPHYPRIVNRRHFERLTALLRDARIMHGGESDPERLTIAPTLMSLTNDTGPLMKEEIFGPILPVLEFTHIEEAIGMVNARPRPLALYLFSENQQTIDRVVKQVSFGGGCINDTLIHFATPYLPFGGVGESGMGGCHGRFGFETFSHHKSIIRKATWIDFPFRYPPFFNHLKLLKRVLR